MKPIQVRVLGVWYEAEVRGTDMSEASAEVFFNGCWASLASFECWSWALPPDVLEQHWWPEGKPY